MRSLYLSLAIAVWGTQALAATQVPLDLSDPGIATRDVRSLSVAPAPAKPSIRTPAAETAPVAQGAGGVVRSIRIEGAEGLPPDQLAAATSAFTGRHLSGADLADLLVTVSAVARAQGYIFAHSGIPAQRLSDGVLVVRVDKGRVDEVRLVGASDPAVAATLAPLVGHAPRAAEIERRLMLAGDRPGVTLGQVRYVREGEHGVLLVPLRHDRLAASAALDNWGDKELGQLRAQAGIDVAGVFSSRDRLTVQDLFSLTDPRELNVLVGRYAYQPGSAGTELSLTGSYARSHAEGFLQPFDSTGMSYSIGAAVSQPLVRARKASLWVSGEFDSIGADQSLAGVRVRRDRLATASLSLNGYLPLAGGRLSGGVGATQGLDVLGATQAGDPLASRPGADGRFTRAAAWANWTGELGGPFSAALAASGQATTRPLLAIEQISIGGPLFGRAYDFNERSGDEGLLGSAELRAKLFSSSAGVLRYVQAYGFGDAGTVVNLHNDLGTGQLYSAGVGARFQLVQSVRFEAEAAFPLNADRFATHDRSPRISFSLSYVL